MDHGDRRGAVSVLMGDVIAFKRPRSGGHTLCREGHHKWKVSQAKQFDVKQGQLVTVYQCQRCKAQRIKAH